METLLPGQQRLPYCSQFYTRTPWDSSRVEKVLSTIRLFSSCNSSNGSTFAALYLFTGNLAVSIVTHALYDFYTFYKTHLVDVAGQMEYAEKNAMMPVCSTDKIEQMWFQQRGEKWLRKAKSEFYLADKNWDGGISRKELRIAMYSYGLYLLEVQSEMVTRAADIDDSGTIDLDEYLQFVGPAGSEYKAVRYTLLGPT